MTKEQAIEHIKTSCYLVGYPTHDKEYETRKCINEALDMAIKALEQQSDIELVTKEEAVRGIACQTPDSMYWWLTVIETIEDCGYRICKIKEI